MSNYSVLWMFIRIFFSSIIICSTYIGFCSLFDNAVMVHCLSLSDHNFICLYIFDMKIPCICKWKPPLPLPDFVLPLWRRRYRGGTRHPTTAGQRDAALAGGPNAGAAPDRRLPGTHSAPEKI